MIEYLTQFENLIILYTPVIMSVISTISTFAVAIKKLRSIKITDETKELLDNTNVEIEKVIEINKQLINQNAELRKKLNTVIESLTKIEVKDETDEQKN